MGNILMSSEERRRLEVFSRVGRNELSLTDAADLLGLSYRQAKRVWARFQQQGDQGLVHRLRGKASNRQPDHPTKALVLQLVREHYSDYGPTLAAECLLEQHNIHVQVETLRRWLLQAQLWQSRRQRKKHRKRRPRKLHFGELIQMDGSIHDWFEGRCSQAVLMVMIDDATNNLWAQFFENESFESVCGVFRSYISCYGLPQALYVDRHSIYYNDRESTPDEILAGVRPQTQFSRAMNQLQIQLKLASSPQAKGRVERANGTLQDRLVKALRREQISNLPDANEYLKTKFLPHFNEKFSVPPSDNADWHRPVSEDIDLDRILSIWETRVVQNDWTVRWKNQFFQLTAQGSDSIQPKQEITVCQQLDGQVRLFYGDQELSWSASRSDPKQERRSKNKRSGPTGSCQGQKPAPDHPWRKNFNL